MEIWIVALCAVLIAAVVIAVVLSNKKKNVQQESAEDESAEDIQQSENDFTPVSASDDIDVMMFENVSPEFLENLELHQDATSSVLEMQEGLDSLSAESFAPSAPKTDVTAYLESVTEKSDTQAEKDENVLGLIKAFFEGRFYIDGTMVTPAGKSPLEMAMDGNNFHLFSEMDKKDIAVMKYDGKLYLMNPDNKTYAVVDGTLKKMMKLDEESLTFEFAKLKYDSNAPSLVTSVKHNGNDGVCYTYKDSENCIEFVSVDGEIVQVIQSDGNCEVKTVLELDEYSAEIPAEMLSFKDYSKKNILSFISEMM